MLKVSVVLFGFVLMVGCVAGPVGDTAPVGLGASAIQAKKTGDAAQSVVEIATAARIEELNALHDAGTREAHQAYKIHATGTVEARQTEGANAAKTETANENATAYYDNKTHVARMETFIAQTPTARAYAMETNAALANLTATTTALAPERTRVAQKIEDEERKRVESIQWEQDTAGLRYWLNVIGIVLWSVGPLFVAVVLAVVIGGLVVLACFEVYLWIRGKRVRSQIVMRDKVPVLYFPNPRDPRTYEILDPALLPLLPPPTPALPAPQEQREIEVNRGGELVEKLPLHLVHGFDERDLMFLFRQIARGFNFSERAMEDLELPHSRDVMSKQQGNTPYARFIDILVRGEIVEGRGGPGNQKGKLVVTDPAEMMRRAKALPEKGGEGVVDAKAKQ